jgi:hypothetical protein
MLSGVAKKTKTPRPPVQAPKRRDTKSSPGSGVLANIPRSAVVAGVVALVAVVAIVVIAVSSGGSGGSSAVEDAMAAAGCELKQVDPLPPKNAKSAQPNFHADVPTLTAPTKGLWSTFPPSAGGHYGAWAVWGFFRAPVNPRQVVHNEEHGGVVMWWGPKVPSATIDQMEAFYRESPNSMLGTPIAGLGDKIALTAWTGDPTKYYRDGNYGTGHIATCTKFDEKAFTAFRDAYRGKGPEGIPASSNTPGSGPS